MSRFGNQRKQDFDNASERPTFSQSRALRGGAQLAGATGFSWELEGTPSRLFSYLLAEIIKYRKYCHNFVDRSQGPAYSD